MLGLFVLADKMADEFKKGVWMLAESEVNRQGNEFNELVECALDLLNDETLFTK